MKWLAVFSLAFVITAVFFLMPGRDAEGGGTYMVLVDGNEVLKNHQGDIVRVTGPTPRRVLEAYCSASSDGSSYEPVRLMTGTIQTGRIGIFRDSDNGELLSIRIREDVPAGFWVAGDGIDPLVPSPAPIGVKLDE
jgi:hypothetical protein